MNSDDLTIRLPTPPYPLFVAEPKDLTAVAPSPATGGATADAGAVFPLDVLIVHERAGAAYAVATALRAHGHHPIVTGDAQRGLHMARVKRFDVLVCGVGRADGPTRDLAWAVSALYPLPAVAMVAGSVGPAERAACNRAGYRYALSDPVDADELLAVMCAIGAAR